jgi:hypothetical protein
MKLEELNTAQKKFLHIYTRRALVDWCAQALASKDGTFTVSVPAMAAIGDFRGEAIVVPSLDALLLAYARDKKWVSKKEPPKILSPGFTSAAGMLKT